MIIKIIIKEIYINGEYIPINEACSSEKHIYEVEKEGEICSEIKKVGLYGKVRTHRECKTWKAKAPRFNIHTNSDKKGKYMYFIVNDLYYLYEKTSYNQLGRLKIYINDVLVSESTEVEGWSPMEESDHISPNLYVNPGEYRIRVENKYGLSAEKTITIN